jgi:hypothetical protein
MDWISKEMLDRRLRVLGVLADMSRRTGKAQQAMRHIVAGSQRDVPPYETAAQLLLKPEVQADMRLAWVAFLASPTLLWS